MKTVRFTESEVLDSITIFDPISYLKGSATGEDENIDIAIRFRDGTTIYKFFKRDLCFSSSSDPLTQSIAELIGEIEALKVKLKKRKPRVKKK